jgi:hypothetical protein
VADRGFARTRAALVLVGLAVAVAAVAIAGCGGGDPAASGARGSSARGVAKPPNDRQRIAVLLDRRAQTLLAHDVHGYAATATGHQRERDRGDARRAATLTLRDVALELRSAAIKGNRARLRVLATWGIRGIRGTFTGTRTMRARRTAAGWRITRVAGSRGLPPWEVTDYGQHTAEHFVVLAPRGIDVDAAGLPASLAAGYRAIRTALPKVRLLRRYLVVVAPDATAAREMTLDIRGVEGLAAISDTAVREAGPARRVERVISQRLLVIWPGFATAGAEEQRRVVAHELTHAVLAGETSGRTPGWLVEGVALYVSGDRRDDQVRAALSGLAGRPGEIAASEFHLRALSAPDAIARLEGARQAGAYAYASAAAFALAAAHSREALLRLYAAFDDESLTGPPGPALVDEALRRTIHEGLAAFDREVREAAGPR